MLIFILGNWSHTHTHKYYGKIPKNSYIFNTTGGASAGVAAAFGAPIGGVLFALEEAASFWNPNLILRTLIASIISSFTLNLVLSLYHGLNTFAYPGLFNLGQFEALPYSYYEIPVFMMMGCIGGILGALWVYINTRVNIFRAR